MRRSITAMRPAIFGDTADLNDQAKAVEQLRAQLAFFGVHRADQDEAGRVRNADAFALDGVDAHRSRVKQHIDQMIVEQVDLVDIQEAAIGLRQQARLEAPLALGQGVLQVERADHPILRGGHRQLDQRRRRVTTGSSSPASKRARHLA